MVEPSGAEPSGGIPSRLLGQAARRFATRTALRFGERTWSFAAFDAEVDRLASGLARRLKRGERVALFLSNRPEYLLLQFASERAGLVRVPVNARATVHEVSQILEDCQPSALFYDASTRERALQAAPLIWRTCVDSGEASGGASYGDLVLEAPDPLLTDRSRLRDLCSINYTSGSSGRPKGVMLSHGNWAAVYRNMLIDRDIRGSDLIAHIGPLTHASGAYFVPWFLRGAQNIIIENGSVEALFDAIERFGVTVFTCVPTVLTRIVNHPEIDNRNLKSLRRIGYGAEPVSQNTLSKALARFGPILTQNYGLTEAMMTCTTLPAADHFDAEGKLRLGSIGRPYTFVEVVLRDGQGNPVPLGEIGEVTVRSDHLMMGYWGMDEETRRVMRDGWLWTGDLARMGEDGFLTLSGRSKDMLISGGFNIYPQELEAALTGMDGVVEAAVLGEPDADWGEIAVAFVVLATDVEMQADELLASLKDKLGIRAPKRIMFVDALPKNANGKVDKRQLRERFTPVAAEAAQ